VAQVLLSAVAEVFMRDVDSAAVTMVKPVPVPFNFVLVGVSGAASGIEHVLDERGIVVGRGRDCDVRIADGSVSRRHARLTMVPDPIHSGRSFVLLEDLGSDNGVRINGRRFRRVLLDAGDSILLGASLLRLDHRGGGR
jgi:pSer/pThr/pTyr-binding forkhead associated (FHA) protein